MDALHRKLKVPALDSGQTLSDYLLAELERLAARPTREELGEAPPAKARHSEDISRRGDPRGARVRVIVVDASALLEFLQQTAIGVRLEARLFRDDDDLQAPHLADVEVVQGLRRLVRRGEVSSGRR